VGVYAFHLAVERVDALAADATLPPRTRAARDLHVADVIGMGNGPVSTTICSETHFRLYDRQ